MKNTIIRIKKRGQSPEAVIADAKRAKRLTKAKSELSGFDVTRTAARKAMVSGLITKKQQAQLIEVLNILDNDAVFRKLAVQEEQSLADQRRYGLTFDKEKVESLIKILDLEHLDGPGNPTPAMKQLMCRKKSRAVEPASTDVLFVNGLFKPELVSNNQGVILMTAEEFLDFSKNSNPLPEDYMAKWSDGVLHETGKGRSFEEIIESINAGTGHSHVICYYVGDAK